MLEPNKFPDIVAVTQSNVATMCDPPGGQPCVILVVPSVSEALTANPAYVSITFLFQLSDLFSLFAGV